MEKETEVQSKSEENVLLKLKISTQETDKVVENGDVAVVEASRAAEQDAMTKLGYMMEEVDKSNRKAARVVEQKFATVPLETVANFAKIKICNGSVGNRCKFPNKKKLGPKALAPFALA